MVALKKNTYRLRIFIYFFAAFSFFLVSILAYQFKREKNYRIDTLESRLENIAGFVHRYIESSGLPDSSGFRNLETIIPLISAPGEVRVTLIDPRGKVLFDSYVKDFSGMENHFNRPEVQKALFSDAGGNRRYSETTGQDFYYYARNYDQYFVRCAVVYTSELSDFLKAERVFIIFMINLFVIMWVLLYIVTNRLGHFITRLRDFSVKAANDQEIDLSMKFPDSEFGEIQKQIVQIYVNLRNARDQLTREKERLYNHLTALNEGIAFFTPGKEKILANSHFIQYINLISKRSTIAAESFFETSEFEPLIQQIEEVLSSERIINPKNQPEFNLTVSKNEKFYSIKAIVFEDRSIEILINDITKPEKRRLLKQQLTSNIAHELKTPLTSIKGYLETILGNRDLPREKLLYFADKAYTQSERLNHLLNDTSLLNNIEEAGNLFEFHDQALRPIVEDVIENLDSRLTEKGIRVTLEIGSDVFVTGNERLLSSVFQNLLENSITYAGDKVEVTIKHYLEDEKYQYFSYSDTGKGIPDEHLPRIFERFYRVDEGRTRETGGTGLGLAIVKNAIQLHKGEISVRNLTEGGLEFLFSLEKEPGGQ